VVADFPTRIARTWRESITSLAEVGEGLVLFAVSWAVWTPFLAILAVLAWLALRRAGPAILRFSQIVPATSPPIQTPRGDE
jgi:hypothetical protein